MLKYLLIFSCCLTFTLAKAQTENELIGIWKVADVIVDKSLPYANNPTFVKLKAVMLKSEFIIKPDHHFIFTTELNKARQTPEGLWHYNKDKKLVEVSELANTANKLMYFNVSKDAQGNMFFKSVDMPFILKVHK